VFCILSLFSIVLAYTVNSNYADYYLQKYWFQPDEVVAQDSTTSDYHYFYFPPNTTAHWNNIKIIKDGGLGVTIDYHLGHGGEKIIDLVSVY
jgi:hypothetical protein